MAVQVYLGFYEIDESQYDKSQLGEIDMRFQRPANMLALLQQTVQFSNIDVLGAIYLNVHGH